MKQVVKENTTTIVLLKEVDEEKYYGILGLDKETKGFITRENFDRGLFIARSFMALTRGNGWERGIEMDSLESIISGLISKKFTVYEFDSHIDLLKWAIE